LALSFIFWFAAEQTWNLYEHVLDIDPYPSIADFFYISAPVFMLISLTIFLKSTGKKISKKNITFASIFSFAILVPSLYSTFEVGVEDEPLEIIIALIYPIVDSIVLVPVIITILFLVSDRKSFFWLMILAGMIIMLAADTAFLFLVINDEYVDGHPVDILWITSYTIWAFMMFYAIMESRYQKESQETYKKFGTKKFEKYGVLIGLILINTTVAILLVGINFFIHPEKEDSLEFISWILVMMVIIFSSIVILLNSKLNKTLQNRTNSVT